MEQTFDVEGPVALEVRLAAGRIDIDPSETGRVEVRLEAHDEESQRLVDAARVELRRRGDGQEVVVDVPSRSGGLAGLASIFGRGGIDCRICCPVGSSLNARTKSADIEASGPLGSVDVSTASGEIALRHVRGDLDAKTASGDVVAGDVEGRASVATASGDVRLESVRGPVSAATASGDIRVGVAAGDVKANTASGDTEIASVASGRVAANSASGDVEIGVRRGARAYLDCTTVSGDASSELDGDPEAGEGDGPLVEIRARTVSGDIRITRAQEVPA